MKTAQQHNAGQVGHSELHPPIKKSRFDWTSPAGVVRPDFVLRMGKEVLANAHKGDWLTWSPTEAVAMEEIYHHVGKLRNALLEKDRAKISEYTADIANLCMKIDEVHGLK